MTYFDLWYSFFSSVFAIKYKKWVYLLNIIIYHNNFRHYTLYIFVIVTGLVDSFGIWLSFVLYKIYKLYLFLKMFFNCSCMLELVHEMIRKNIKRNWTEIAQPCAITCFRYTIKALIWMIFTLGFFTSSQHLLLISYSCWKWCKALSGQKCLRHTLWALILL